MVGDEPTFETGLLLAAVVAAKDVRLLRLRRGLYARRARLEEACFPHTLRHTFAKNLVDAEVSLDRVAALLGHENLNTTRIYTTPSVHDLTEAVERLEGE